MMFIEQGTLIITSHDLSPCMSKKAVTILINNRCINDSCTKKKVTSFFYSLV